MDQIICINTNSFPAPERDAGIELFSDSIQGVLELHSEKDRFFFYLDCNEGSLYDLEIANGYSFGDFIEQDSDPDLALFLYEIEDKSPALDSLSEEQIEEMAQYNFYVPHHPADSQADVYGLAWTLSGYLFTLNTAERWCQPEIEICRVDEKGRYVEESLYLKNIASVEHGKLHYENQNKLELTGLLGEHIVSEHLTAWYAQQTIENQIRMAQKIDLACRRNFNGGRPLFDSLHGDGGYREIRLSAHSGGAIRIIFKHHKDNIQALLCGFIKKSNDEGYEQAIAVAEREYQRLLN
ncbi:MULTISPECIES: type II toxin-antitoxin system RelE/ParE family toxin [Alteromonas]|jgi:hypothetical protein|uniref:Uncharacterized protein n=2 Tax=root TaxID=1 RepID=A0A126Q217_ALTMA|nr:MULTISPECIES: type II toxin-antitoxin system RelE/ParE family toxin [Alteromonas]AMJ99314.1 hypothetical protein AVL55_14800 [Alteromonas macleodii]MCG7650548.1 type II toxin-antitoxin system RelE/ParE family toxin [Alteromonas sp. MmMcT2-5]